MPAVPTLVLLDSHAIIHRAFHAIRPLTTSHGEIVNAVYGFVSMLFNVLEIERPDYLVAAFDEKGPTFRHEADDEYKATRPKAPDALVSQFAHVRAVVNAFNIPLLSKAGFEADDIIATLAKKLASEPDLKIIIVSGDRDLLQIVTDHVSVHDLTGGYRESVNFTPAVVREKFGFAPEFIPDFKGLAGDTSDNLAGVAGIGPKTATELIQQFGHLEEIYRRRAEISSTSVREKITNSYDDALHYRQMATVHRDVPMTFELASARLHDFDRAAVLQLFKEFEFKSLAVRFAKLFPTTPSTTEPKVIQQSLF